MTRPQPEAMSDPLTEPLHSNPEVRLSAQEVAWPLVGVVILNWNGWQDTVQAVSSFRLSSYKPLRVYVVDNASSDGSVAQLRAWDPALTIIEAGANLGWSGGNNVGIVAARRDGCRHVLLFNNDALCCEDTVSSLVAALQTLPDAACVGSRIMSQSDPDWVEFGGSVIDDRTQMPRQLHGRLSEFMQPVPLQATVAIKGCSMLLTEMGIARLGLLTEDYFLNFDETDWCYRANAVGMRSYLAWNSVAFHKGAVSFGGTGGPLYRYFITRNRLLFARRHLNLTGRWFAWRGAFWELRQALKFRSRRVKGGTQFAAAYFLSVSVMRAVLDYCSGRFGDCPALIRELNGRFRDA